MEIAILSMQRVYNYGSVLQAYSLKMLVEDITGLHVDFLDPDYSEFYPTNMNIKDADDYGKKPYLDTGKLIYIAKKLVNKIKMNSFRRQIERFWYDALEITEDTSKNVYDLVIEGSDEVFKCARKYAPFMYGAVPNAKKLITYAAACGSVTIDGIPEKCMPELRENMKKFSVISVRDEHTREYIREIYNGELVSHMDPVLMGDLYKRNAKTVKLKNYMIIYAYGNRIHSEAEIKAIKSFAKKRSLKLIAIGSPQYWCDKFLPVSPMRALDYFKFAECVVTDTFHGAIFSIINHRRFAVIVRASNANKLGGLLTQLSLGSRIVNDMDTLDDILEADIDYKVIDARLGEERKRTREYLEKYCAPVRDGAI